MQKRKNQRHVSLLLILLITGAVFTGISIYEKKSIYQDYAINLRTEPILTVMFQGIKDGVYPWNGLFHSRKDVSDIPYVMASGSVMNEVPDYREPDDQETKKIPENENSDSTDLTTNTVNNEKPNDEKQSDGKLDDETRDNKKSSDEKANESEKSGQENETEEPKENTSDDKNAESVLTLAKVDQSYFDDALFIGDSRTEGLSEYSYLNNATFYADAGLSVYSIFTRKICKVGKKMVTIEDALKKKNFKKIYVMLGVNELGTGNSKTFKEKYREVIEKIEELQPNAYIVIEGIMNVGKELSESHAYFNNKNISRRNAKIRKLADDKRIFYLDINSVVTDEDGYLPKDITFDDVHLKAKYYDLWADYLLDHGIVEEKSEEE